MVRGPAAVLVGVGLLALAQAYVLIAPELPVVTPVDLSLLIAAAGTIAAIYICAAAVAPVSDVPPLLWLVALGGVLLVATLNVADVGAAATPAEALAYAAIGGIFALGLLAPSLALAVPVLVSIVDVVSTLGGGLSESLAHAGPTHRGDPLSLEMPDWGTGLPAGRLGISDAVFLGVFLVYARRFGFRPVATPIAMALATLGAVGLGLAIDAPVPVVPFMAAAYFLANADRLGPLLRAAQS